MITRKENNKEERIECRSVELEVTRYKIHGVRERGVLGIKRGRGVGVVRVVGREGIESEGKEERERGDRRKGEGRKMRTEEREGMKGRRGGSTENQSYYVIQITTLFLALLLNDKTVLHCVCR